MTRFLLALICVAAAAPAAGETEITIVNYNIRHGRGMDNVVDLERIAEVIRAYDPDVVLLQEVDRFMERTDEMDQPREFARLLDMEVSFVPNLLMNGGQYGNASLSRFPIIGAENVGLPNPHDVEPRGCLRITVDVNGQPVDIWNTHLGLDTEERRQQIRVIMDRLRLDDYPTIVAGDFNEEPDHSNMAPVLGILQDSFAWNAGDNEYTVPVDEPTRRIDYIFAAPPIQVHYFKIPHDELTQIASDHLPLVGRFTVPRPVEGAEAWGVYDMNDSRLHEALGEP